MEKATNFHYIWLILPLILLAISCSESVTCCNQIPPPQFPSFEAADVTNEFAVTRSSASSADSSDTTFLEASDLMSETLILFSVSGAQSFVFDLAAETEPEFTDGTFIWKITPDTGGEIEFNVTFEVTAIRGGALSGNATEWAISFEPDFEGLEFDFVGLPESRFELLKGFTTNENRIGEWNLRSSFMGSLFFSEFGFLPANFGFSEFLDSRRELFDSDELTGTFISDAKLRWEKFSDSQRLILIEAVNSQTDDIIRFQLEQNGQELRFELQNVIRDFDLIQIRWNLETKEGFIETDGNRRCWDSSFDNVEC
ncbi:MAG: hypothetical protein ACFCU6_04190 [Balneolaceae bacterium]